MNEINKTLSRFKEGAIDKPTFIKTMHEDHHAVLFDYAAYLTRTNIKKIEIEDGRVVMTSRDRGVRIVCAPGDYRIAPIETLNFFDYEKDESSMMENFISDGDVFFDIGANIGWYSINIAVSRRLAKVFSFEPIKATFENLKKNIEINRVLNVVANNFGFSNHGGRVTFYYYPEGSGNASSANVTDRTDLESMQCEVKTLDDYIGETSERVDFIKCDVEGAELLVFQGGIKTIAKCKPIIFSEILRKWSAKFNYGPNEIFNLLRGCGYVAFTVRGSFLLEFGSMNNSTVETNFFFLHADKHANLIRRYTVAIGA